MFVPNFDVGDTGELIEKGYHVRVNDLRRLHRPLYRFKGVSKGQGAVFYMFESVNGGYVYSVHERDFALRDCTFNKVPA